MRSAFLLCAAAATVWAASPFSFRERSSASLEVAESGRPVFVYNHGMLLKAGAPESTRRSSYIHPMYAPDGTVVTDDFPKDHPHHRGIFWTWPAVKVGGETYDLWAISGIRQRFERWTARETRADSAHFGVENGWYVGERKILKETVDVVVHRAASNAQQLDFVLRFEALEQPVGIMGRPEAGYGGFGIRFAPREGTAIRTDAGQEARDTNLIPHAWAALEGDFAGRHAGARIDDDAANPGFPNGWCLRRYGFLGVDFPGVRMYDIQPGAPLVLKYRVSVFSAPR